MSSKGVVHLEMGDFGSGTLWKDEHDGCYTFEADFTEELSNAEMKKLAAFLRKSADRIDADLKKWQRLSARSSKTKDRASTREGSGV